MCLEMEQPNEIDYQLTLLDLYADEIIKRIAVNHSNLGDLLKLVQANEVEKLKEQHPYEWNAFAEHLWTLLYNAPTRGALYCCVLAFLHQCEAESQLHHRLYQLNDYAHRSEILPILSRTNEFLNVMDPFIICDQLSSVVDSHQIKQMLNSIKQTCKKKGATIANKHILRSLQEWGRDIFFDFLNAVYLCGNNGKNLVHSMYPNFERLYELLLEDRRENYARGVIYFVSRNTPLADVINSCLQDSSSTNPYRINLNYQSFPPSEMQQSIDDIVEALYDDDSSHDESSLRSYQKELAEPAYSGSNTVICAPTGCGKTVVAASVVRRHLLQGLLKGKRNKVCFFVPNTTFLEQQAHLMQKFLPKSFKVISLSGESAVNVPLLLTLMDNDVIVITPQLIVNLIMAANRGDDDMKFSLTLFSLLIFDEAHHADENHPYNVIMSTYHEMKRTGAYGPSETLPQVIGLTASLGVGKAKNEEEAVRHIIKMCANLDAHELSRVRYHINELLSYSNVPTDESIHVKSTYKTTRFYAIIDNLMQQFENLFLQKTEPYWYGKGETVLGEKSDFTAPASRVSQAYENWFENLLSRIIPQMIVGHRQLINEYLEYIRVFYRTQQLCAHFPCNIAQDFLKEEIRRLHLSASNESVQIVLASGVLGPLDEHDKCVNKLYETLLDHIHKEFINNFDGRVIVFLRTREMACRLRDGINKDKRLNQLGIKSEMVTGINVSSGNGGQNANIQRDNLIRFSNGEVKVLCATSVADEGIDIQKCTLVIKYNYVTNAIAHIQRRGRGRAESARCLLLTDDIELARREQQNVQREKLMNAALRTIDNKSTLWFRQEVDKQIQKMNDKRIRDKILAEKREQQLANKIYQLHCRKCDAFICSSESIVTDPNRSQYICVDDQFWSRVTVESISFYKYLTEEGSAKKSISLQNIEKFQCCKPNCHVDWGRVVKLNDVVLPVISAKAFVLVSSNNERYSVQKWKKVLEDHFNPRIINTCDYALMKNAPKQPECSEDI